MVCVRRVAPILLLAVTIPAWAEDPQPKKTVKTATTTTSATSTAAAPSTTTSAPPATQTTKTETKAAAAKTEKKTAAKSTSHAAAKAMKSSKSHPPRELHMVGDHWTAYNPPDPTTYPAGAKTYTIKAGDTLWGIATQYFKNGYLWPQVWESNTWITDAHWIYPGDVLLIEGEAAAAAEAASVGTTTTTPLLGSGTTATTATGPTAAAPGSQTTAGMLISAADAVGGTASPVALGTDADIYCYGFIGDPQEPMPNAVHSFEDAETRYEAGAVRQEIGGATGDLVYLNGGTSTGLVAGETYILVEPDEMIHKPGTPDLIGRHYQYIGQIRVLCADDTRARGIITQACSDVRVGTRLRPMPQLPIPLARIPSLPAWCDPASGKLTGNIVHAQGGTWLSTLGEGQLVQVDLGRDDQIQPGDFLTVFRDSPVPGQGRQVLGEIGILTTEGHTATGKIVLMRYAMRVGDFVEVR